MLHSKKQLHGIAEKIMQRPSEKAFLTLFWIFFFLVMKLVSIQLNEVNPKSLHSITFILQKQNSGEEVYWHNEIFSYSNL